jgi:O-antigen/teichoic acid export membrane protein
MLLLLAWPIAQFLQISGWTVVLAAIACGPLTIMGAYAGVAQGQHRWGQLAAIYVAMGAGRIVCGAGALLIRQSLFAAMVGLAVGAFAPAVVGRLQRAEATLSKSPRRAGQLATELWRNGYGLLAFFVCTNVDVLLARHVLDHHDAGIYAAGAILTKTALFLPAFVLVTAFPSMARDDRPRRWVPTFVTVAALGLIGIAATIVLPGAVVTYAGGHQYNQLRPDAWLFVLEGVLFALLQILVYDKIAARSSLAVLLWLTALVIATIALSAVHSPAALVSVVIIGVASTILASIAFALRTTRLIC